MMKKLDVAVKGEGLTQLAGLGRLDVAVIGGGLAGLVTAIYLAKAGKSVMVFEKSNRIGGRAMTMNKNGALFNLGAHALYRGGEAYAVFQELGLQFGGGTPLLGGSALWRNKLFPLPTSALKMLTSTLLSWPGKIEFTKLMLKLGKMDTSTVHKMSLRHWAEQEVVDPMVRHLFYALSRTATYAYDPDGQLAGPVLKQIQRSIKQSVLYINGGWQTIVDQLQEQASRLGVHLINQAQVSDIECDDAVQGLVLANGARVDVSHIVSTITPAETERLLGGTGRSSATLHKWKSEARAITGACLDLCLKRLPVPDRHFVLGVDQPLYFSHHSKVAKLTEDGSLVMHLVKYHGTGDHDAAADERQLKHMMDLVQPGWRKEVVAKQYLPHMTIVHDYQHTGKTDLQPGPAVPEIRGLYVAGDWASHGEMLADAAVASAKRAAVHIVQEIAKDVELRRSEMALI